MDDRRSTSRSNQVFCSNTRRLHLGRSRRGLCPAGARKLASLRAGNREQRQAVWTLFVDRRGNLWVATHAGISFLPKGAADFVDSDIHSDFVSTITQAPDGTLWYEDLKGRSARSFRLSLNQNLACPPQSLLLLPKSISIVKVSSGSRVKGSAESHGLKKQQT